MTIKSYEQKMQEDYQRKQQQAAQQQARLAEIDAFKQMELQRKAEQEQRLQASFETYKRVQIYKEALERGEIDVAAELAKVQTLDQAMAESTAQMDARQRQQQRELDASPEHQRFMQAADWVLPPSAQEAQKREYFASQHEMTVDESYSALQAAKQDVAKEEKQLKALQSGRVLSSGELPYQQQRLEQAKQQEQQALAQFNELAGVLSQT